MDDGDGTTEDNGDSEESLVVSDNKSKKSVFEIYREPEYVVVVEFEGNKYSYRRGSNVMKLLDC